MSPSVSSCPRKRSRGGLAAPAVVLTCSALCLLAGLFERPAQNTRESRRIRTSPDRLESADRGVGLCVERHGSRVVYPYSVIPGGVRSRDELADEMSTDPVVAAHYSDFSTADGRMVRALDEKLVHVSYRKGNRIFWTAGKLRLAGGELLMTDGRSFVRARCGNRVSPLAHEPTSPEEPPAEELDTPTIPGTTEEVIAETSLEPAILRLYPDPDRLVPALPLPLNPTWTSVPLFGPNIPPVLLGTNSSNLAPLYLPFGIFVTPPNLLPIVPASPQPGVDAPKQRSVDIPNVPESGTLLLFGTGLLVAILCRFASKKHPPGK